MLEFFNYLNSIHPLSAEATAGLMKVVRMKELRKGQVWLQEGAVCDKFTFVIKGLMKMYFESGYKEMVIQIVKEKEAVISAHSFFLERPSHLMIRALEPSVVLYITVQELNYIKYRFPELNIHLLEFTKSALAEIESHLALILLLPKDRWRPFLESAIWINSNERISDKLIAAYLGVSANSICNWRKDVLK